MLIGKMLNKTRNAVIQVRGKSIDVQRKTIKTCYQSLRWDAAWALPMKYAAVYAVVIAGISGLGFAFSPYQRKSIMLKPWNEKWKLQENNVENNENS